MECEGMEDAHRGCAIRKWINKFHKDLDVLCLQELKAQPEKIEFQIKSLFPNARFQVDYNDEGRAGASVIVLSDLKILAQGVKGDVIVVWYTMETTKGKVNISFMYAPNERARRCDLWKWMSAHLPEGNWLWAGDSNMAEHFDDSIGPLARIHGSKERSWKRALNAWDYLDTYLTMANRKGHVFTR